MTTQNQRREIIFKGQLQQKVIRKCGFLLRRKKTIYEDEFWVILCVHEGGICGIPHLEWYSDLKSACEHNPIRVQDLLDCQYVNVAIGEERTFVVGFIDKKRPILELFCPTIEERRQWVTKITETLNRLNCLLPDDITDNDNQQLSNGCAGPRSENLYIAMNEIEDENKQPNQYLFHNGPMLRSSNRTGGGNNSNRKPLQIASTNSPGHKLSLKTPIPMNSSLPSNSSFTSIPQWQSASLRRNMPSHQRENFFSSLQRQQSHPFNITSTKHTLNNPQSEIREEHTNDFNEEEDLSPPPLPPRQNPIKQQRKELSEKQLINNNSQLSPILPSSPIPCSPPKTPNIGYSIEEPQTSSFNRSQYDQLSPKNNNNTTTTHQYQQLSRLSGDFEIKKHSILSSKRYSGINQRLSNTSSSTNSNSINSSIEEDIGNKRNFRQYDVLPTKRREIYQTINFSENVMQTRKVNLSMGILADNVIFVDWNGKVLLAGWKPLADKSLQNILHFGDELCKITGITINSVRQLPQIYSTSTPGIPIELILKSNSSEQIYTLKKGCESARDLGIVLHKRKNKISYIKKGSIAHQSSLPNQLPSYFYIPEPTNNIQQTVEERKVPAVITELNGIPLSLSSKNEQFFRRVDQLSEGTEIILTLHPTDFCELIMRQLKAQCKNFAQFMHDS
ncbi:PH domain-containing protein [Meloidogyne graminicola]|uniref:PH domain-containing protein n=1 Tax=Meloidogyne graminicola TaxID=189291 RepID=A0A8S9ZJJ9_9BILA|nr:PH domain-containing protein [Meloidogyne graminicola]